MKTIIISIFLGASVLCADADVTPKRTGETLLPLNAGEDAKGIISYGLFAAVSGSRAATSSPVGKDLFLILRNTGAKHLNMSAVTVEDFSLQDSKGAELKLHLWTRPEGMAYGETTVIHLKVDSTDKVIQPLTLHFKTKPGTFVPLDLVISGIEPNKK